MHVHRNARFSKPHVGDTMGKNTKNNAEMLDELVDKVYEEYKKTELIPEKENAPADEESSSDAKKPRTDKQKASGKTKASEKDQSAAKKKTSGKASQKTGAERIKEIRDYVGLIAGKLDEVAYVKPGEIPAIDLYMDQVTTFMDDHLESSKRFNDDKLLTKTMINNYTKNNLLPPPKNKKYSKDHMYLLIFIYYLKNILSISDTQSILSPLCEKFFKDGSIDFEGIYDEIFKIEHDQAYVITREVVRKFDRSLDTFTNVEDPEERQKLQMFSFISMLCFDVYMKKQMILQMIDDGML